MSQMTSLPEIPELSARGVVDKLWGPPIPGEPANLIELATTEQSFRIWHEAIGQTPGAAVLGKIALDSYDGQQLALHALLSQEQRSSALSGGMSFGEKLDDDLIDKLRKDIDNAETAICFSIAQHPKNPCGPRKHCSTYYATIFPVGKRGSPGALGYPLSHDPGLT